ncbi:unnamed protein product (macronuclear) [Paramecium tetraurelia]|uniref:Transmembrane protein n=1 Tax=Paramecium tetraurelia TaxID=5888 RepID=A0CVS3_PARTE|nr:uncharacterized protein GSPATT00039051001 [Paramecium tetraurelia]CAK74890.1 unnamed protein product [Paramecium tetraurelia]|eukprot:XP_001442287.1 hypothetical protein (macronuclear) [Paramecium tetraurelia strain d4-2]
MEYLFDTKILIGFGVGVLTASLYLIPTLKEQPQENAQNSKMKLSTKSLPSTQDLKQVYIKKNEKQQSQTNSTSNDGKKKNQNAAKTEANQQDFYFNLDDGIRKKRKLQEADDESSPRDQQSSQKFSDNQGSQNFIQQNNIINQKETDQFSKKELGDSESSGKQENEQPQEKLKEIDDQLDPKISDQSGEQQQEKQQ